MAEEPAEGENIRYQMATRPGAVPAEDPASGARGGSGADPGAGPTASEQLPPPEVLGGLPWRFVETHETEWDASGVAPTLNMRLDGRIVPSATLPGGARVSFSHLLVLDNFIGEPERAALMSFLTGTDTELSTEPSTGQSSAIDRDAGSTAAAAEGDRGLRAAAGAGASTAGGGDDVRGEGVLRAPGPRWERATADRAGLAATWGLKDEALRDLARCQLAAMKEVQSRLAALYPEYAIAHLPSDAIQHSSGAGAAAAHAANARQESGGGGPAELSGEVTAGRAGGSGAEEPAVDCNQFVANAAVYGDCFQWHLDADPSGFPSPSPWSDAYGDYCNGEPGRPLLVSLLLYLDAAWPRDWDAETLFLDDATDCGVVVRPRRYRAVLMDQDVLHRVSTPSQLACGRPRFSLVWKLAFLPRDPAAAPSLARPQWGPSTPFGSAARLDAITKAYAGQKRKKGTKT